MGLQYRYQQGQVQVNCTRFLSCTKDENKRLVVVPEEAEVVMRIYWEYLEGASMLKIARGLEADGIRNGAGNTHWQSSNIGQILRNEKYIGDALLAKTYTIDFLNKKRVRNTGIVPQYYVENDHEGIIPKEIFMRVQEEMIRRRRGIRLSETGKKRNFSSSHCFSQIVFCGKCGEIYRRVHWNNRGKKSIVWRCVSRLENTRLYCDARTVPESELQRVAIEAMNKVLTGRDGFLAVLEENITAVVGAGNDAAIAGIDARLNELQTELLKRTAARAGYDDVALEIDHLRTEKQKLQLEAAGRDKQKERMDDMRAFLREQPNGIPEFDEKLVRRLVEKVTVYEDKFTVEFKSGVTVDVDE